MSKVLEGQTALVTGASRGIGRASALALGRAGAYVVINYRDNHRAAVDTLEQLNSEGAGGELAQFDVSVEKDVEDTVKKIVDAQGKVDILINNAGITADNLLMRSKPEEWEKIVGTNLRGPILCAKAVCRGMLRQRYGRIVNLSSVVGQMGNVGQSLYAATKAGILGFTKSMARELGSRGITVNAVAPGFIESEMTGKLSDDVKEEFRRSIPLGRFGSCDEVAELITFLAAPGAGYITGQVISINGGLYM